MSTILERSEMARLVNKWQSEDGTLFDSLEDSVKHDGGYICPKCKGSGHVKGDPIKDTVVDEEATGLGGQFAQPVFRRVVTGYKEAECDLCSGKGWTADEKRPITKTVGWE